MSYRFVDSLRAGSGRFRPDHVELYSKNEFEQLVHLVGFIIRIYHDARSAERRIVHLLVIVENNKIKYSEELQFCILYFSPLKINFSTFFLYAKDLKMASSEGRNTSP